MICVNKVETPGKSGESQFSGMIQKEKAIYGLNVKGSHCTTESKLKKGIENHVQIIQNDKSLSFLKFVNIRD